MVLSSSILDVDCTFCHFFLSFPHLKSFMEKTDNKSRENEKLHGTTILDKIDFVVIQKE